MRNGYLITLIPILSLTVFGYADQVASQGEKSPPLAKGPHFFEYNNRMALFNPFHQVYERIKPDAFYVGIEGFLLPIVSKQTMRACFLDAELRMGYNFFFNRRDHLTPFAGVAYLQEFWRHHHRTFHIAGLVCGAVGLLYDHEFNAVFNLGINVQLLMGGTVSRKHLNWGSPVIGSDIALPITFRFGRRRHWDFRIEPFNIYLHGSKLSQNYFGFRNTVGYRF